jgi:hypothetical protein
MSKLVNRRACRTLIRFPALSFGYPKPRQFSGSQAPALEPIDLSNSVANEERKS